MTQLVPAYRWTREEFLRAHEAGVFDKRVEFVNGEVWPVVIGDWHGETTFEIAALLRAPGVTVSGSTLVSADSLPDPDCWVRRSGAEPSGVVGSRLHSWSPGDVLLVVEVSDETKLADLTVKAALYGSAGYPTYWVITTEAVFVHTDPTPQGYRNRTEYRPGDQLPIPYADTTLDVAALIA